MKVRLSDEAWSTEFPFLVPPFKKFGQEIKYKMQINQDYVGSPLDCGFHTLTL